MTIHICESALEFAPLKMIFSNCYNYNNYNIEKISYIIYIYIENFRFKRYDNSFNNNVSNIIH